VARRFSLGRNERLVVSVTPTSWGLRWPLAAVAVLMAGVILGGQHAAVIHRYEGICLALVVGPPFLVLVTRTIRWRSHKVHVTTKQVAVEGGVLRRSFVSLPVDAIVLIDVQQDFRDRLRKRGLVQLRAGTEELTLGPVRHPEVLARLIDQTRRDQRPTGVSYDTVFEPTLPVDYWPRGMTDKGR